MRIENCKQLVRLEVKRDSWGRILEEWKTPAQFESAANKGTENVGKFEALESENYVFCYYKKEKTVDNKLKFELHTTVWFISDKKKNISIHLNDKSFNFS